MKHLSIYGDTHSKKLDTLIHFNKHTQTHGITHGVEIKWK